MPGERRRAYRFEHSIYPLKQAAAAMGEATAALEQRPLGSVATVVAVICEAPLKAFPSED